MISSSFLIVNTHSPTTYVQKERYNKLLSSLGQTATSEEAHLSVLFVAMHTTQFCLTGVKKVTLFFPFQTLLLLCINMQRATLKKEQRPCSLFSQQMRCARREKKSSILRLPPSEPRGSLKAKRGGGKGALFSLPPLSLNRRGREGAKGKRKEGRKGGLFLQAFQVAKTPSREGKERERNKSSSLCQSMEAKSERIGIWLFILLSSNSTCIVYETKKKECTRLFHFPF